MSEIRAKIPLFLSRDEVDILLKIIRKDRHRLGFMLMSHAGLRVSEVCALRINQIHLARGYFRVIGKGRKERIVPLTEALRREIERYLERNPSLDPEGPLVGGNRRSWHDMCKKYARLSLGRQDIHCHTLRHSYATLLYEQGVPLERISQLLGHARLDTTMIYAHISLAGKSAAVNRLNSPLDRLRRRLRQLIPRPPEVTVRHPPGLIARESEQARLYSYLTKGVSVMLVGPGGSGKSALLQHLKLEQPPIHLTDFRKKQTLMRIIIESRGIHESSAIRELEKELRPLSLDELFEEISHIRQVVILDDITESTKLDRRLIARLGAKCTVCAASSNPAHRTLFATWMELKPLDRRQARLVLSEMIHVAQPERKEQIINDILHTAGGNMREAAYMARQLQLGRPSDEITSHHGDNRSSIAPLLTIVILFFVAWILKSYTTTMVAMSYAMLVVFRLVFYRYIFTPAVAAKKRT